MSQRICASKSLHGRLRFVNRETIFRGRTFRGIISVGDKKTVLVELWICVGESRMGSVVERTMVDVEH